jgi:hypothetical protein
MLNITAWRRLVLFCTGFIFDVTGSYQLAFCVTAVTCPQQRAEYRLIYSIDDDKRFIDISVIRIEVRRIPKDVY